MESTRLCQNFFSVNKRAYRQKDRLKDAFCLFSFSNFTFGFHNFYLKKLKKLYMILELVRGKKISGI